MRKLIIILIIFSSCTAKKVVTEYKEVIKRDSIYVTKEKKVFERVVDTFKIEKPCDSLGNLKQFKRTLITPQGKITLNGFNNVIQANIDLNSYENTIETKYKLMYDKKVSELSTEIVKYKTPFWMWVYIVLATLIIFLLLRIRL
jgi:hypothetical protein